MALRESWTTVDGAALRAARIRAGLTQHALVRLIGVAGGERISPWELERSALRAETRPTAPGRAPGAGQDLGVLDEVAIPVVHQPVNEPAARERTAGGRPLM